MTALKNIHHLNFVVADLDVAVASYQDRLGLGPFEREELQGRGVSTARTKVGDVWIVLVSPDNDDCEVGRYLAANGEGFFLLSFGVDNLDAAIAELAERGTLAGKKRSGLYDWQVADLDTESDLGIRFHLTEPRPST
jgi:methylmalonyl-CoA/ethylmalonyl-CoA epimerase